MSDAPTKQLALFTPTSAAAPASREQLRSRRARDVRARTVSVKRLPKAELELGRRLYPAEEHADVQRPRSRAECAGVPRPCPFVSCANHLFLDVSARTGAIKLNFPDLDPDELPADASCQLDVAERGEQTLENVGRAMNMTRERVRQIEVKALAKIQARSEMYAMREFYGESSGSKRRLPVLQVEDDDQEHGDEGEPEADEDDVAGGELAQPGDDEA